MYFPENHPERAYRASEEERIRSHARFLFSYYSADVGVARDESMGREKVTETLIVKSNQEILTQIDKISVAQQYGDQSIEYRFTDRSLDIHNYRGEVSDRFSTQILLRASQLAIFSWSNAPEISQEFLIPAWFQKLRLITETRAAQSREIQQFYFRIGDPAMVLDKVEQKEFLAIESQANAGTLNVAYGIGSTSLRSIKKWADKKESIDKST